MSYILQSNSSFSKANFPTLGVTLLLTVALVYVENTGLHATISFLSTATG